MRILHWLNNYLPNMGGIQTLCADLLPDQMARGHEVKMLTGYGFEDLPARTVQGGIEVHRVDSLKPMMNRDPGGVLRAKIAIQRIVEDYDPDLIHLHPCGPELPYFLQIHTRRPVPTMLTVHNNYSQLEVGWDSASSMGQAFDRAGRIAAVSDDARRWLLSERPDLEPVLHTVHNGIPDRADPVSPLPWSPPQLTFAGRLAPQKRLDVLLRAFVPVIERHPHARLVIAGEGPEHRALVALAGELGISSNVRFLGGIDPSEVPAVLEETTVFTMSSEFEGLPIALLEAARQGRPMVVTDVGGMAEVVRNGESGFVVDPDDPAAFGAAVLRVLDDPALAADLGNGARTVFETDFGLDACADAYERLYAEVVEAGTSAA